MADKNNNNIVPFDPSRFAIPAEEMTQITTESYLTGIAVRKPNKREFVRVHPTDEFMGNFAILKPEKGLGETYIVVPQIAVQMPREFTMVQLRLAVTRQEELLLWPVPLSAENGKERGGWGHSQREAVKVAETHWLRMQSNMNLQAYDTMIATAEIPEPVWPNYTWQQYLNKAFPGDFVIEREDHPVLLYLQGKL